MSANISPVLSQSATEKLKKVWKTKLCCYLDVQIYYPWIRKVIKPTGTVTKL